MPDEVNDWLNQRGLTRADAGRLQQLEAAVARTETDPDLSPEEKADLISQLQTAIDPLRRRAGGHDDCPF